MIQEAKMMDSLKELKRVQSMNHLKSLRKEESIADYVATLATSARRRSMRC